MVWIIIWYIRSLQCFLKNNIILDFGFFIFWLLITGLAIWTGILSFYLQWQATRLSWAQELELLVSVFRWAPFSLLNRCRDYLPVFSKPDWRQMQSLNFNHQKFFSFGSMCGGKEEKLFGNGPEVSANCFRGTNG